MTKPRSAGDDMLVKGSHHIFAAGRCDGSAHGRASRTSKGRSRAQRNTRIQRLFAPLNPERPGRRIAGWETAFQIDVDFSFHVVITLFVTRALAAASTALLLVGFVFAHRYSEFMGRFKEADVYYMIVPDRQNRWRSQRDTEEIKWAGVRFKSNIEI